MLEEVQSTHDRKINIVINGVKEQPDQGFLSYQKRAREAANA